jgi:hypothetical protein
MTVAHPSAADGCFVNLYVRLVSGLGVIWLGGWLALLLYSQGNGIAALIVLVSSAMLGGQRAGARASALVLVEVTGLLLLALQVPLLLYVWADLGPLTLVVVAAIQVPVALAGTWIARQECRAA